MLKSNGDSLISGISPDDSAFAQKILESFNSHFLKEFNVNLSDFLHRNFAYYLKDRESVIVMIVTSVFAYAICSQSEERYIQYFEVVNTLNEEDAEEVRMFLNNLVQDVEARNLSIGSLRRVSSSRRVIFGFENKLSEYEVKMNELNMVLTACNRELKRYKEKNETLVRENDKMKKDIHELTDSLSQINEKYEDRIKNIVNEKEAIYTREIKDLRRKLEDAEIENTQLKEKVEVLTSKKKVFKDENRAHRKTLSVISDNYVDKDTYNKKMQEKAELERKLMEMENNYAVEISETKSLKDQLEKTKNEKKIIMEQKDKEYEAKLNEIRKQVQEQDNVFNNTKLNKSALTNMLNYNLSRHGHTWDRLTDMLDNDFTRGNLHNSDFDSKKDPSQAKLEGEFIDRLEKLQNKFEELKALSSSENEGLKNKIKQMSDEIYKLKSSRISESNFATTRTYSRLKSRDISAMKKNTDISEEFVQKMVDMEKKIKSLTNENKYLHQSIIKNLGAYKTQTGILYTVIANYVGKLDR